MQNFVLFSIGNARANRTQSSLFELLRCSRVSQIVKSRLGDLKMENSFFQFPERNLFVSLQFAKVQLFPKLTKKHSIFTQYIFYFGVILLPVFVGRGFHFVAKTLNQEKLIYPSSQQSCLSKCSLELKGLCRSLGHSTIKNKNSNPLPFFYFNTVFRIRA